MVPSTFAYFRLLNPNPPSLRAFSATQLSLEKASPPGYTGNHELREQNWQTLMYGFHLEGGGGGGVMDSGWRLGEPMIGRKPCRCNPIADSFKGSFYLLTY